MKILLLYFSGTGNTKYVTKEIKKNLLEDKHTVEILEINTIETINLSNYDMLGIGYPIYAFNAPKIVEERLKLLSINNIEYFIYKTSGEPLGVNNGSSIKIKRIMKKNNCKLLSEYHLMMPYNILFRYEDDFVKHILLYNSKYIKYITKNVISKQYQDIITCNIFQRFCTFIFKIQRLGSKINSHLYKVDYDKCILCNKCINNCPSNNISLVDKKFHFDGKCEMCMRCSFNCPTDCISIGFLNNWKVNGEYNFNKILDANSSNTQFDYSKKKYYRHFVKYYKNLNKLLSEKNY